MFRKLFERLKSIWAKPIPKIEEHGKLAPHEKAALGQGNWGRQDASAKPQASISAKVIRKDGTIEDLGIISGGK